MTKDSKKSQPENMIKERERVEMSMETSVFDEMLGLSYVCYSVFQVTDKQLESNPQPLWLCAILFLW